MRYESGSKVLKKRMPAMAAALGVPLEKMLEERATGPLLSVMLQRIVSAGSMTYSALEI